MWLENPDDLNQEVRFEQEMGIVLGRKGRGSLELIKTGREGEVVPLWPHLETTERSQVKEIIRSHPIKGVEIY